MWINRSSINSGSVKRVSDVGDVSSKAVCTEKPDPSLLSGWGNDRAGLFRFGCAGLAALRKADETRIVSIRLAGGCEGAHDCVDARIKLGDRERF
jgi:hypothetical protein